MVAFVRSAVGADNVVPLNVRFALSSMAPEVPASTTRPEVRSETVAEERIDSPPEMFAPPLPSI
jgi:uncharacterized protein (UPF0147 family)